MVVQLQMRRGQLPPKFKQLQQQQMERDAEQEWLPYLPRQAPTVPSNGILLQQVEHYWQVRIAIPHLAFLQQQLIMF